ncbi:hypothetical protein RDABS01_026954, partial [Bienertia sinuspersici]
EFSVEEVQTWVSLKWLTREPIEVEKASRNTFIFYCKSGEDRDKLLALSTACYKGALIIFKRWIPNSSLRDHDFSWGSIWVKIEGLPLHINQMHAASSLLERFGSVIYFDGKLNTEGPQKVIRARMRIPLRGALIPGCYIELEPGKVTWVDFRYEGVFVFCTHCGSIGHKESHCKKSPKKAKEGIINSMNKLCTHQHDCIINEDSIMPVYSRKICGLKGTLGNKNTSVNLVLPTQAFRPENTSDSSDSCEEEEEEEKGENTDDQESRDSDEKGDDSDDGDPGPSKKRPADHSSSSSGSSNNFGRPSKRERKSSHGKMVREEGGYYSSSRKRKVGDFSDTSKRGIGVSKKPRLLPTGSCEARNSDPPKLMVGLPEQSDEEKGKLNANQRQPPYSSQAACGDLHCGGSLMKPTTFFMSSCKSMIWAQEFRDVTMQEGGGKLSEQVDFHSSKEFKSSEGTSLSLGKLLSVTHAFKIERTFALINLLLQLRKVLQVGKGLLIKRGKKKEQALVLSIY